MNLKDIKKEDLFKGRTQMVLKQNVSGDNQVLRETIDEVTRYDVFDFLSRTSALNLFIENQNKSILLDALIAAILTQNQSRFSGKVKMSNGRFKKIIARIDSIELRRMIDPSENAFVERVQYYGNHWIFPGINYSPSYTLQGFLNVLFLRKNSFSKEFTDKAQQLVNFILFLSDQMANALCYDMDSIKHIEESHIKVPEAALLKKAQKCVRFKKSLIDRLIPDKSLHFLLFSSFSVGDLEKIICQDTQPFCTCPFLLTPDESVIVLNPAVLSSFLVHQLILLAKTYNIQDQLINSYNNEIWKKCCKNLTELGHKKIKEKIYGIELLYTPERKEAILTVGNDKLLFVHFIGDPGTIYEPDSLFSHFEINNGSPTITERTAYFIDHLPYIQQDSIFQLIILNSFGRTISCKLFEAKPQRTISLSPFELHCVAINEKNRECFIPKYIKAKEKIRSLIPPSLASELNALEIYTSNDYSFYLGDDINPETTNVYFGLGDSLEYVIRAIKREDRHLIDYYDNIHLKEIIQSDPVRHIYFSEGHSNIPPELVVKFANANIWFTIGPFNSEEEINIYCSIVDALSYWLAEAKCIVESMVFKRKAIRIHISLDSPTKEFSTAVPNLMEFDNYVHYSCSENEIHMQWGACAYQVMNDQTNNAEKEMLISLLKVLNSISDPPIDINGVEELFANPLKKKFFSVDITHSPHIKPITGELPIISEEEKHQLLDDIGKHFLSKQTYSYGRVPDEKRAELANNVVGFLYGLLQKEVTNISPDLIYEKVCRDLEVVMYQMMRSQQRYSYDIACYPEHAEEILKRDNETNKVSIALKFFAEYIAAVPPSGKMPVGTMQYDRILAICSLIIDWAYKNDLFYYQIFNSPVEFLPSGRIGMSVDEHDTLSSFNTVARMKKLDRISNPSISTYSRSILSENVLMKLNEAFEEEYGFTYNQYLNCIQAISDYGDNLSTEVKRVCRKTLVEEIFATENIPVEQLEKVIDHITLQQRDDFLKPPKPFTPIDVYPWRFNRELSFTRRPIIQYNDDLIWGNRQLQHMWRYEIDLIATGKYKARCPKLKRLIGTIRNKCGDDFNLEVAKALKQIDGLHVYEKVSKFNHKRIAGPNGNDWGDIDVFYIVPEQFKLVVGEVKDFSFAKNPYEMQQEYHDIFVDGEKPCFMTKHKRRVKWVKDHINDVCQHFGLPEGPWTVSEVMFVSEEIISNDVYHLSENIVVFSDITPEKIRSV